MNQSDFPRFKELLTGLYSFYRADATQFHLDVWWGACKPYSFEGVKDAFNRHLVNPDNGQFLPKPADVVKLIDGGTQDRSMVAWSLVDKALRSIGTYRTVVFDDPVIHSVVSEMGGWIALGAKDEKEWPFVAKEFQTRYRATAIRGEVGAYPKALPGLEEADRARMGLPAPRPKVIGNVERARLVFKGGGGDQKYNVGDLLADTAGQFALPDGKRDIAA